MGRTDRSNAFLTKTRFFRNRLNAIVGATPGFPVELGGSGALHAAFLKESRIRGRVQCSAQEIRVAPIVFGPGTLPQQAGAVGEPGAPVLFQYGSGMTHTPSGLGSLVEFSRRHSRPTACRGRQAGRATEGLMAVVS
jgi:hypothetical protein